MLPSARPLTTSCPIRRLESTFLDRSDQFGRLALVAIDAEHVGEVTGGTGLIAYQQALPILCRRQRVADRRLVAADLLDDRLQHVNGIVIGDRAIVTRNVALVLPP